MEVHLYFELLIPCKEPAPIRLQVLVLHIFLLALAGMAVQDVPNLVDLILLLTLVVVIGEGVDWWWERVGVGVVVVLLGLAGLSSRILLPLPLVSQLIVDIGIQSGDLVIIYQNGDLALPIPQFLPLQFHLLPSPNSLRKRLILHQHIRPLRGQLIPLHLQIPHKPKPRKQRGQILLIRELRVIPYAGIQHGYQMLFDLVKRIVADYVEPF